MPFPFIVAGIAGLAGLYGIVKGAGAVSDNKRARELTENAQELFDQAKAELEQARVDTTTILEELGRIKLQAWDRQLGRFVTLFGQIQGSTRDGGRHTGLSVIGHHGHRVSGDEKPIAQRC